MKQIAAYYRKHSKAIRVRRQKNYWNDPAKELAYAAARYRQNPDKYKLMTQEWRLRFLKKHGISASDAWRKKNPLRSMALVRAYQMRKRGATVEMVSYDSIFARDKGLCHICGTSVTLQDVHFDHVIPLARGGLHIESNIKVSHARCNMAKGARLLSELGRRARVLLKERRRG